MVGHQGAAMGGGAAVGGDAAAGDTVSFTINGTPYSGTVNPDNTTWSINVAGADPEGDLGEQHRPETHLIPLMLDAIEGRRPALTLFGTDYPTPDGTCVRDYVHVSDLVDAHVLGLNWLLEGKGNSEFNLGSGRGFSVREVIAASTAVTNRTVPVVEGPRRAGDAAALVSGSTRAVEVLGWKPRYPDLADMIRHAHGWGQKPGFSK